jgi:hypothetical protein
MIIIGTLLLAMTVQGVQTPAPRVLRVVVGLADGQQLIVEDPQFSGIIQGRATDALLTYRQDKFHGKMPVTSASRVEFGEYKKGQPFSLTITLRNGQKLQVESERYDYLTIIGKTDVGTVTIKHPDPVAVPLRLSKKSANRKADLTIQYLEFPAPQ